MTGLSLLSLILMVLGFVLFLLTAFWRSEAPPKTNLSALGLACWILAEIIIRRGS